MTKRQEHLIFGIHAVRHALIEAPESALELWVQASRQSSGVAAVLELGARRSLAVHPVSRTTLDRLVEGAPHQGVVLRCRTRAHFNEAELASVLGARAGVPLLLVLDGVQDPRNLGACLRTAEAAGVDAVIIPAHRSVGLTGTVCKVASGAAESVPLVEVGNLARALRGLKGLGVWLIGADAQAEESLYRADLTLPTALVLGGEGQGLRQLTRRLCDKRVQIPMRGQVESLNVSVAAGICLFEAVRQRAEAGVK